MFVPAIYGSVSNDWPREIVLRYPLAALATNGPVVPFATHLPAVLAPGAAPNSPLTGSVLMCHMNRANPHWAALDPGTQGRLIFTGPHSYITPTTYRATPAAPTWDFVSVHLLGTVEPLVGLEATLEVVERTVEVFERRFGDRWDPAESRDYFEKIAPGVGAFRFHVEEIESMFKLSQEKSEDILHRVIERLDACPHGSARDLAGLMRELQGNSET
jgi:transcriptional regulator